jgi:hypothetical protein
VRGGQPPQPAAQQVGLAAAVVAEHQEVRVVAEQVDPCRAEAVFLQADGHAWLVIRGGVEQVGLVDLARQRADRRRRRRVPPAPGNLGDQPLYAEREAADVGQPVGAGQGGLENMPGPGESASRRVGRQGGGRAAADLRLDRVVEAQFQAAAEVVAQRHAQVAPAVGRHHQVDAVVQTGGGQLERVGGEVGELAREQRPVVDQHEHLAVAAGGQGAVAPRLVVGGHAVQAVAAERLGPLGRDRPQLPHQAVHPLAVGPAADSADVRQLGERVQAAAAQVDRVDLNVARVVGEGEPGDQRGQQGGLARPGRADQRQVAAAAVEVDREGDLRLLARAVGQAERDRQPARSARPHRRGARVQDRVQRQGRGQRVEPYRPRPPLRPRGPAEPCHRDLQLGAHPRGGPVGSGYRRRRGGRWRARHAGGEHGQLGAEAANVEGAPPRRPRPTPGAHAMGGSPGRP